MVPPPESNVSEWGNIFLQPCPCPLLKLTILFRCCEILKIGPLYAILLIDCYYYFFFYIFFMKVLFQDLIVFSAFLIATLLMIFD